MNNLNTSYDRSEVGKECRLRVPMWMNTFSFWVLGFPAAYLAAKVFELEPRYIWTGFVLGLTVSAFLLTTRFRKISKQAI